MLSLRSRAELLPGRAGYIRSGTTAGPICSRAANPFVAAPSAPPGGVHNRVCNLFRGQLVDIEGDMRHAIER